MLSRSLDSGYQEALKWLAVLCMVIDHAGAVLYDRALPYTSEIGRLAMPLFTLLLAYNLARPGAAERGVPLRTLKRLVIFGAISTPPFILAFQALPLNVMFTLALSTGLVMIAQNPSIPAIALMGALLVSLGTLVDFPWFGAGLGLAAWAFFSRPGLLTALGTLIMLLGLCYLNRNGWALLALPLLAGGFFVRLPLPRSSWYGFYALYPAHLAVLGALKAAAP